MKKVKTLSVERVKKIYDRLKSERSVWETHWQEIADYIMPRKSRFTGSWTDGSRINFKLLENVGINSNELLAGALHGLLTNPNALWFELTTGNPQLDMRDEVRRWQHSTVRLMHNTLNNSNFQTEVHELYQDLAAFGTAVMFIQEHDEKVVRFSTRFLGEVMIDEAADGSVNQLYRQWEWTAHQIIEEFGEKACPKKVRDEGKKGDSCKFKVIHAVYPMELTGETSSLEHKFVSQYLLPDEKHELSHGTYADFPYVVPRWSKASGEKYGRSPGMVALPEVKVLNKMNETMLIGAQKLVDPPLQVEDDGVIGSVITRPAGITYVRAGSSGIKPIFNDTRLDFGYQAVEDRRRRVRDSYYVDQLQLQQGGPMMTATEVLQRTEEKMRLLGPMLGRMQSEFLRPLIDRLFRIMWDREMIPPPPQSIAGMMMDVRYSSLIAKTQRLDEGQAVMRTVQAAAPFGNIDPTMWDNLHADNALRTIAQIYGAPPELFRSEAEVEELRQQRAEAQRQQMEQQQQMMAQQQQGKDIQNAATLADSGLLEGGAESGEFDE